MNNKESSLLKINKNTLYIGCAGSKKTSNLIELVINNIHKKILILSFSGSVCNEIKTRISNAINIEFTRINNTKHYIIDTHININITNFDSWVHTELEIMNVRNLNKIGDNYKMKTMILKDLINDKSNINFHLKNTMNADILLIDELQDLEPLKVFLLVEYIKRSNIITYAFGDYLQTIFDSVVNNSYKINIHPINIFKILQPYIILLNKCYRIPKAHVDFVNVITQQMRNKYSIQDIETDNTNIIDKPFIFPHDYISTNTSAQIVAYQVGIIINNLMEKQLAEPQDIAIIMRRSHENIVFEQLKPILQQIYKKFNYTNRIEHLQSIDNRYFQYDYNATQNTILSSIHAMKGKERKVIILLGLSKNSIPDESCINKNDEIIFESLLNVALTRSTKYLFVGFTKDEPSIYLSRCIDKLNDICYLSYNKHSHDNNIYYNIYKDLYEIWLIDKTYIRPVFITKFTPSVLSKRILNVSDISIQHEYNDLFKINELPEIVKFGNKFIIRHTHMNNELYKLFGIVGELLILKKYKIEILVNYFNLYLQNRVFYTDRDDILNYCCDVKINSLCDEEYLWDFSFKYLIKRFGLEHIIEEQKINKPVLILHSIFETKYFKDHISNILKNNITKIKSNEIWNLALLYNELKQYVRKPSLYMYIDYFNENIDILINNINNLHMFFDINLKHDNRHIILNTIKDINILNQLSMNRKGDVYYYNSGYTYGLCGKSDFINNNILFEIKCSTDTNINTNWLSQALLYNLIDCVHDNVQYRYDIIVINLMSGYYYKYNKEVLYNLDKQKIFRTIFIKNKTHELLIEDFINKKITS